MAVHRFPKWVIEKIDRIRRNYLWNGDSSCSSLKCLVNWEMCCKSKIEGGLGIINLYNFNSALLAKWLWKYRCPDVKSSWKSIVSKSYYSRGEFFIGNSGGWDNRLSHFWKSVLNCFDFFKLGCKVLVHSGNLTYF